MNYTLEIKPLVFDQIQEFKAAGQKQILDKISLLFKELVLHPRTGIGKVKQLKGKLLAFGQEELPKSTGYSIQY